MQRAVQNPMKVEIVLRQSLQAGTEVYGQHCAVSGQRNQGVQDSWSQ